MNDRVFIGIDPGTKCGWAVLDEQGVRLASGTWDISPRRHEGGGMRFVRLDRYLSELLDTYDGWHRSGEHRALLAYEEVRRHLGTDAAQIYGGIVATVTRICEGQQLPYQGIPVATVKRRATGKGNASKGEVNDAAARRWGLVPVGEDEADALWIADSLREGLA